MENGEARNFFFPRCQAKISPVYKWCPKCWRYLRQPRKNNCGGVMAFFERVKKAELVLGDGSAFYLNLDDRREMQYFNLPETGTRSPKLIIVDFRKGRSRNNADTSISEIHFFGN